MCGEVLSFVGVVSCSVGSGAVRVALNTGSDFDISGQEAQCSSSGQYERNCFCWKQDLGARMASEDDGQDHQQLGCDAMAREDYLFVTLS